MGTSLYLARLIGPVLLVVGASMLLDPAGYSAISRGMLDDPALIYLAAVLGLLGGVALVLAHNVWVADWRVVITLLGWVSILDSASWILARRQVQQFWSPWLEGSALALVGGAVVVLLGAALSFFGYRSERPILRR